MSGSRSAGRRALYAIGAGVWVSGAIWLLVHEPWWLRVHGAFAFASVWMFGLLWGAHVTKKWPASRRRWSGGVLTGILAWLTLSGYLLYYTGNETARSIVSVLHWTIGLACPIPFVWHRLGSRRRRAGNQVTVQNVRN